MIGKLILVAIMLIAAIHAEDLKFFLVPVRCWDALMSGSITMDCVIKTGVQGINLLNMTVAFYYRMPQIMKLLQNKNSVGISPTSIIMELFSLLCVICYYYTQNYSIWNYGELYVNWVQLVAIFMLVYKYGGVSKGMFYGSFIAVLAFFASIMAKVFSLRIATVFMSFSTALYVFSKLLQIKEVQKTKYSKNLSLITLLISPAGIFSRLLTSVATLWHDKFLIVR